MRVKRTLPQKMAQNLKDMVFVGRLISDDEVSPPRINASVMEQDGDGYFYIKCLSLIPDKLKEYLYDDQMIFMGNTRSKQNVEKLREWEKAWKVREREKVQKIQQTLQNKLLVFTLLYMDECLWVELLLAKETEIEDSYALIPQPLLKAGSQHEELERRLLEGRSPIVLMKYPSEFPSPTILYYDGVLYCNISLKSTINSYSYVAQNDDIVVLDMKERWDDVVEIEVDTHLCILSTTMLDLLREEIEQRGSVLRKMEDGVIEEEERIFYSSSELKFLHYVKQLMKQKGFHYEERDIINFHTCLKTGGITILAGMSGIGKSRFVSMYGEALGLTYGKELVMIPITPSYQEPNDLLGYLHPTTGVYHESETGLTRLLLEAERNPDTLYMIIFDEMNLSQIEYWFSPFISLLEMSEENRYLSLFHEHNYYVDRFYKPKVHIGNNILVIGTINIDETTKDISDRLLDRMNVVFLSKLPFYSYEYANDKEATYDGEAVTTSLFYEEWKRPHAGLLGLKETEVQFLDDFHVLLQKHDPYLGISYRIASGIAAFLANVPTEAKGMYGISREEAFDLQVKQRILTKIRGASSSIGELVGQVSQPNGAIVRMLSSDKGKEVSSFEHSIHYIKQKAHEWDLYGYVR
ncbi:McrB family protein [Priestia taiwanensis]|uniref:ATPase dynein-related AAA domain-containing protein n=1 Tax=Priestia taiwanensis TaxID=1347902 RepID=A0A917EN97_9BACI|nr:hypothetical protein [Priestia taiwanensis]MBM7362124.1 hypothetical protein [Priestia taiwanensis]GGE59659.1 hypothetical protein GCM10007140_07470 [Priestia taiwanensis]